MNDKEFAQAYVEFQTKLRDLVKETKLPAIVKLTIIRELEFNLARYVQTLTAEPEKEPKKKPEKKPEPEKEG